MTVVERKVVEGVEEYSRKFYKFIFKGLNNGNKSYQKR